MVCGRRRCGRRAASRARARPGSRPVLVLRSRRGPRPGAQQCRATQPEGSSGLLCPTLKLGGAWWLTLGAPSPDRGILACCSSEEGCLPDHYSYVIRCCDPVEPFEMRLDRSAAAHRFMLPCIMRESITLRSEVLGPGTGARSARAAPARGGRARRPLRAVPNREDAPPRGVVAPPRRRVWGRRPVRARRSKELPRDPPPPRVTPRGPRARRSGSGSPWTRRGATSTSGRQSETHTRARLPRSVPRLRVGTRAAPPSARRGGRVPGGAAPNEGAQVDEVALVERSRGRNHPKVARRRPEGFAERPMSVRKSALAQCTGMNGISVRAEDVTARRLGRQAADRLDAQVDLAHDLHRARVPNDETAVGDVRIVSLRLQKPAPPAARARAVSMRVSSRQLATARWSARDLR